MIPSWLREKLASPPQAGAGIHAWLFSVARQLHAHMPPEAIASALQAATATAARRVTEREIRDAVNNSREVAWTRKASGNGGGARDTSRESIRVAAPGSAVASGRWPRPDNVARRCRVADAATAGIGGLADLWEESPVTPPNDWTADDWLDVLFPGAEWLCLATDHPATARTRRREKWAFGPADNCGLVVPSPMTAASGKGLDGRTSRRCLDNTGPRRWLVIEFDKLEDGTPMSPDEQAALHWHFRESAAALNWPRLALVVSSGGKSLHGWYGPCTDEAVSHDLMAYAVSLGADPATWNRCQLVRLPAGLRGKAKPKEWGLPEGWGRRDEIRQAVYFYDPTQCNPTNNNSLVPSVPSDSMPLHAQTAA